MRPTCLVMAISLLAAALPFERAAYAQNVADYFRQHCVSCHTIGGGRLVGPDLKDVTTRQSREWLVKFMVNPQAVISSGDAYARKLLAESGGVMMPPVPGLNEATAQALLELIDSESKLPASRFKGTQVSDRPFLPADIQQGRALFTGHTALKNGGPACLACHTSSGVSALGGGDLGPDLTKAYERLGGRKGLSSWLSAPATPTMQAVFAQRALESDEILPVVAFLQDTAQSAPAVAAGSGQFGLLSVAIAAAIAGLMLINKLWIHRLRGVRANLVSCKARGEQ